MHTCSTKPITLANRPFDLHRIGHRINDERSLLKDRWEPREHGAARCQIIFRFRHHGNDVNQPAPITFDSNLAEPMRRALSGQSGSMVGLDYRGEAVLAAYEPVVGLNLGIVVKTDLDEVRHPFLIAALISILVSILLVSIGVLLLRRTLDPLFFSLHATTDKLATEIIQHQQALEALRESDERFRQIADAAEDVFWLVTALIPKSLAYFMSIKPTRFW